MENIAMYDECKRLQILEEESIRIEKLIIKYYGTCPKKPLPRNIFRRLVDMFQRSTRDSSGLGDTAETFRSDHRAREVARLLFERALEVDDAVQRLMAHPNIQAQYNHDGQFFTPKDPKRGGFHDAYDGWHFLNAANEARIRCFLGYLGDGGTVESGLAAMLRDLEKNYALGAFARLLHLEETGDIRMPLCKEDLEEIRRRFGPTNDICAPPPLPQDAFWEDLERQMRS